MKVADLVKISAKSMELLSKHDIRMGDFKFLRLYSDYEKMREENHKTSYIVAVLAERYIISEASVYRILRRFRVTISI